MFLSATLITSPPPPINNTTAKSENETENESETAVQSESETTTESYENDTEPDPCNVDRLIKCCIKTCHDFELFELFEAIHFVILSVIVPFFWL